MNCFLFTVNIVLYVLLAMCILMIITSSMLIHGVKNVSTGYIVFNIITVLLLLLFVLQSKLQTQLGTAQ